MSDIAKPALTELVQQLSEKQCRAVLELLDYVRLASPPLAASGKTAEECIRYYIDQSKQPKPATWTYTLYCDDAKETITGDHPLELRQAVQNALDNLSTSQILEPHEDWFQVIVDEVCELNGFQLLHAHNSCDVEEMYWEENYYRASLENKDKQP